jgi:hypothetical protein
LCWRCRRLLSSVCDRSSLSFGVVMTNPSPLRRPSIHGVTEQGTAAAGHGEGRWAAVPAPDAVPGPPSGGLAASLGVCAVCRAPGVHCMCAADPDDLRYALAQISLVHHPTGTGSASGAEPRPCCAGTSPCCAGSAPGADGDEVSRD